MLLPQETMFNESSTKLQSDGRPVSSSVGDGTLSADNVKSDQHPSASSCLVKCLLQRLCSLLRPTKCSPASNTHPTAEKMPDAEAAGTTQAEKVAAHSEQLIRTARRKIGQKSEPHLLGRDDKPRKDAPASSGPTRCKPSSQRASTGPRKRKNGLARCSLTRMWGHGRWITACDGSFAWERPCCLWSKRCRLVCHPCPWGRLGSLCSGSSARNYLS